MQYAEVNAGANEVQRSTSSKDSSNTPPSTSKTKQKLNFQAHLEEEANDSDHVSDEDDDAPAKKKSKTAQADVLGSHRSAKKASKKAEKDSPAGIYVYDEYGLCVLGEWGVGHGMGY